MGHLSEKTKDELGTWALVWGCILFVLNLFFRRA